MVFLEILVIILVAAVIFLIAKNFQWKYKFEHKVKEWIEKEERKIREDAILRSARTLSGKTLERLIPFLEKFDYDPHDVRWLGDPVDLVVFDGYSKNNGKDLDQIVFLEVKSGQSKLTKIQNKIKQIINERKIKWEEFRI